MRPIESAFRKIARHLPQTPTEDSLRSFLASASPECLIWQGQFKPKNPTVAVTTVLPSRTKYGFDRLLHKSKRNPVPFLSSLGHNPVRDLYCEEGLDPLVWLTNTCGDLSCINPLHYRTRQVVSARDGRRGELPS